VRSDEEIKQDILDELAWDPKVDASKIGVTVRDGAVTLSGHVDSYPAKVAAEKAVMRVKGVLAVAEEVEVRLPTERKTTDEDVAERIAHVLAWNITIPDHNIQAEVRHGLVTLTGEVDWQYQRENVRAQVANIAGVVGVTSLIKLRPRASSTDVKREITRALHRHANVEASHVEVTVEGSRVTLRGMVKSFPEKRLVEDAAWAVPGVTEVMDDLHVR
jgi:osmotically-inducible protein OsmY